MVQRLALSALLLSLASSVHAADVPSPVTGSASITGLSYHLVNLDPSDGITPWIQFQSGTYVGLGSLVNTGYDYLPIGSGSSATTDAHTTNGDIFTAPGANYVSGSGEVNASYGPAGTSVTVRVNADQYSNLGGVGAFDPSHAIYNSTLLGASGMAYGSSFSPLLGVNLPNPMGTTDTSFTLSPHTLLVIDGQMQSNAAVDLTTLKSGPLLDGISAGSYTLNVTLMAANGVVLADANGQVVDQFINTATGSQARDQTGVLVNAAAIPPTDASQSPFSVQFSNDSAEAVKGGLVIGSGVASMTQFSIAAVPESSTWVLMGLGLLGVAVAARRQERRA
ncbi:MAG: PEP-CTERM sorting domain-containing protein [Burkholderiales bacterium]|nr:MAG: PEP-CTERM sorting domain-containing protein [Burkholderiales bacterium]